MKDVFKAIADPTRREILLMVCKAPTSVNEIAEQFDMSRPAVSKHIKILENSDLLKVESDSHDARQRNCYAQLSALNEVNKYINELESFWDSRLGKLDGWLMNSKEIKED